MKTLRYGLTMFILGFVSCILLSFIGYNLGYYHVLNIKKEAAIEIAKGNILQCMDYLPNSTVYNSFLACKGDLIKGTTTKYTDATAFEIERSISFKFDEGNSVSFTQSRLNDLVIYSSKTKSFFVFKSKNEGNRPWSFIGRP